MKVKWLGHSAFIITSDEGIKILTDPYRLGMFGVNYDEIKEAADIVVVTHEHPDHNNVKGVPGNPEVIKGAGTRQAKGIEFRGRASFHDDSGGSQRGPNNIFCFTVNGVRLCHLGDLGHTLSDRQLANIGEVDVLLTPMAGNFTLDAAGAHKVVDQIKPRVVIPMHYQTDKCPTFPVTDVEPFLAGKKNVKGLDTAEVEFKKGKLPSATEIVVLKHAL
ncbi:MAG: MBL fold metallo-hydrolase [Dehalococcoidia bacterium]|nr:MBL fold metallo-hydrolase [Dehalococcoidia bacterium]